MRSLFLQDVKNITMILTRILIFLFFPTMFIGCKSEKPPVNEVPKQKIEKPLPFIENFKKFIAESYRDSLYPGGAIVIVKDTTTLLKIELGMKQANTSDSINDQTIFRLASVSKGFAAVLTSIFVQNHKLSWDDKVLKYLPSFKLHDSISTHKLTIRNLLSQTTGLPTHTYTNMIEDGVPYSVLRDKLQDVPLITPVGTAHSYQNVIYSVIGDILEKVSGKPYDTLLNEMIFKPLHMKNASASYADIENSPNVALPHVIRYGKPEPVKNTPEYYTVLPAAGINASISDMEKWLKALIGDDPQILSPEMLKEVFKPEVETPKVRRYHFMHWLSVRKTYYAMGFRVLNFGGDTIIYHAGYVRGYNSEIAFSTSEKVGIVILSNAPGAFISNMVPTFFSEYFTWKEHTETKKAGTNPLCINNF